MKVLVHAVAPTGGGGGRSRIRELAHTLPAKLPDDQLVFLVGSANVAEVQSLRVGVETSAPPRWVRGVPARVLWEHLQLPRSLRAADRPDAVLAPFNIAPIHWPGGQPPTVVIVNNLAPYVPWIRAMYRGTARLRLDLLRRLTDATLARAAHVFVLSQQAFDLIGADKLTCDVELLPMAPPIRDAQTVRDPRGDGHFLVVGDLLRYKGVETVVEAAALLRQRGSTAQILVVGRPWDVDYARNLEAQIRRLDVAEQVRLVGYLPHDQVLSLMRQCIACVVPSRFENPSRIPTEAMAVGAPVIASDIPAFRETCGDAVLYFHVQDAASLADRMLELEAQNGLGEDLRRRGATHLRTMDAGSASERIAAALERVTARVART